MVYSTDPGIIISGLSFKCEGKGLIMTYESTSGSGYILLDTVFFW